MSIFDGIKKKLIQKRETNPLHEELKFAVSQKPKDNLDKYDPFDNRGNNPFERDQSNPLTHNPTNANNFSPTRFEPMEMPLERPRNQPNNNSMEYMINQLDAVRAQNEMILKRLQNIERILNGRQIR